MTGWERRELQQINDRKRATNKNITEARNKKRKTSAVEIVVYEV